MAIPVIDTHTSILSIDEGGVFAFQPYASNTPTSWAASNLPAGLTIHSVTGLVSGTVTASAGFYTAAITATNVDGTSTPLTVYIPVYESEAIVAGEITIRIDVDIVTGKVRVIGMEDVEFGPPIETLRDEGYKRAVMLVKAGDRFPVTIGFTRDGVLQDLTLRSLRMKCKEFMPDGSLNLLEGAFTKEGTGKSTRFRTILNVSKTNFAGVISNTEDDTNNYFDAFTEIEFSIVSASASYDETKTEAFSGLSANETVDDTLVFTALDQLETSTTYSADLDLTVSSNSTQDATLAVTVDVIYNSESGLFEASNITGATSIQGDDDGAGAIRTTHSLVSVTGTAAGVDFVVRTVTSVLPAYVITIDVTQNDFTFSSGLITYAGELVSNAVEFGSTGAYTTIEVSDSPSIFMTRFNADAATASMSSDEAFAVEFDETADELRIYLKTGASGSLTGVTITNDGEITQTYTRSAVSDTAYSGTQAVNLVGAAIVDIHRRTSQTFIVRTEADIIADE